MTKEKIQRKVRFVFLTGKRAVDFTAVVSVFYILLYQIKALRKVCKTVCEYLIACGINVELSYFKSLYFKSEWVCRQIIILWFALSILLFFVRFFCDWRLKKETGDTRFEESLFRYLRDNAVLRCFLVTGKWGSGKTYEVNRFFDKYYGYSRTKVYRISCFGLSSRKDLVEEINQTIEKKDTSFYALVIRAFQYLPVIGGAIEKFLKKSYTYTSVKRGSVFIFDDFERITSRTIEEEQPAHIYRRSQALRRSSNMREFDDIKKEFEAVERSFLKVEDFTERNARREDYDKYIAVTGLINEMIEACGVKVIIVCNSDILGEKFLHDILRSKLNCMEYRKFITEDIQNSVLDRMLESKVFEDVKKQQRITKFLVDAKAELGDIARNEVFMDLRLFRSLLEAFTDTAALFEEEALTDSFLYSLFNSIVLAHLCYYGNSLSVLDLFQNGANMKFLVFLFCSSVENFDPVWLPGGDDEMKWIDAEVSAYWILNMSAPKHLSAVREEWEQYPYFGLECEMLKNVGSLENAEDYGLLHVLYYQKRLERQDAGYWLKEDCIQRALKGYDLSRTDVVQDILGIVYTVLKGKIYMGFQRKLFQTLSEGCSGVRVETMTYLHEEYNEFLEGKGKESV